MLKVIMRASLRSGKSGELSIMLEELSGNSVFLFSEKSLGVLVHPHCVLTIFIEFPFFVNERLEI